MSELLYSIVAQTAGSGAGAAQSPPSLVGSPLVMMMLMFGVIYFMVLRPQQKRQRQQESFLDALKRGDKVITSGGIHGTINGLTDQIVTLEIAKDVRIRVARVQIAGPQAKSQEDGTQKSASNKSKSKAQARS